jgi:ketosteroid isomerase-like protein
MNSVGSMLKSVSMRIVCGLVFVLLFWLNVSSQSAAQKIYDTERAFEKMVAEKGIRAGFIEFLSADGVMFFPEAANARETWTKRAASPAALTWNPIRVGVSYNGVLAYSIGNSIYRPKGKDDANAFAGHYLSVWMRQSNGEYRAVLDAGINHDAPASVQTSWAAAMHGERNERGISAADSSVSFYQAADSGELNNAYKTFLADDAVVMRDGAQPFMGKNAALGYFKNSKGTVKFANRKSFIEAVDLAYVYAPYTVKDNSGLETERGNFVQVWRLRGGKWQIVADLTVVIPKASN